MTSDIHPASNGAVVERERRHMRHGVGVLGADPPALRHGVGARVVDEAGRDYLDLFAGAGRCVLGHGHAGFALALQEQARKLAVTRHPFAERAEYVQQLAMVAPPGLTHVSLFSTGSEAVDAAVRIARGAIGRRGVIVFSGAFHGRTSAVAPFTDDRWTSGAPRDRAVIRCGYPTSAASGDNRAQDESVLADSLAEVDQAFSRLGSDAAAVLVEPLQGTAGNRRAAAGFLQQLAERCSAHGALLIADEVLSGFARTGSFFASAGDRSPDLLVMGKGMGNGFPVSAVLSRPEVAAMAVDRSPAGYLSSTFGGNPLAVAAGRVVLAEIAEHGLVRRAGVLGDLMMSGLRDALGASSLVRRFHGQGLMIGIELTDSLAAPEYAALDQAIVDRGLLVGRTGRTLRINPPLVIRETEVSEAVDRLAAAVADVFPARGIG